MKKNILSFLVLVLIKGQLLAQTPIKLPPDQIISNYMVSWLKGFNEINDNNMTLASSAASKIASDSQGNIILAGAFTGKFSIGNDTLINSVPLLVGNTYLIKLTPDGNLIWAKNLSELISGFSIVRELTVDDVGNIFVTGHSYSGDSWLETVGTSVVKFSPNGNISWLISMPYQPLVVSDLELDANGNLLLFGYYFGKAAIGNDSLPKLNTDYFQGTRMNFFLAKVSQQGYVSLINAGNDGNYYGFYEPKMAVDRSSGEIYFTGRRYTNIIGSSIQLYLAKLSPQGQKIWQNIFDTPYNTGGDIDVRDIEVDALGNIYITGTFSMYLKLKNPNNAINSIAVKGGYGLDAFAAKFNKNGENLWIRNEGVENNSEDYGKSLTLDKQGNVWVSYEFDGPPLIGNTIIDYNGFNSVRAITKYSPQGDVLEIIPIIGYSTNINSLTTDSEDNLLFAGGFEDYSIKAGDKTLDISTPYYEAFYGKISLSQSAIFKNQTGCAVTKVEYKFKSSDPIENLDFTSNFSYNSDSTIITESNDQPGGYRYTVHTFQNDQIIKREYYGAAIANPPQFSYSFEYNDYGLRRLNAHPAYGPDAYQINFTNNIWKKTWHDTIDYSGSSEHVRLYQYYPDGNMRGIHVNQRVSSQSGIQDQIISVTHFTYDAAKPANNWLYEFLNQDLISDYYLGEVIHGNKNALIKAETQTFNWTGQGQVLSQYYVNEYIYTYQGQVPSQVKNIKTYYALPQDTLLGNYIQKDTLDVNIHYSCNIPHQTLAVYAPKKIGDKNTEIVVPIKANQFKNLLSGQFSVKWNAAVAQFVDVEQYGLAGMDATSFGTSNTGNGKLSFSWSSPSLQAQTLADSSTLFAIRFNMVGNYGDTTNLKISGSPVTIEFADANYSVVPTTTCPGVLKINATVNVSGKVLYSNNEAVKNVQMELKGVNTQTVHTTDTDANGNYSFKVQISANNLNNAYMLTPSKCNDPDPLNGIDVQDVAAMRRHILGTQLFSTPFQTIAADVNQSETVTTLDIVFEQALILGIKSGFPNGKQWTFVDAASVFLKQAFPYPQKVLVVSTTPASLLVDFVGIKLGDVNESRDNSQSSRAQVADVIFESGYPQEESGTVTVPVRVYGFKDVSAFQFTMKWDTENLDYIRKDNGSVTGEFGEHGTGKGMLTTVWDQSEGKSTSLPDGSTLFTLKFQKKTGKANVEIELNSATPARVFDGLLRKLNFVTQQEAETSSAFTASVYPNPFAMSTQLNIKLRLPEASQVGVEIITIDGRKIRTMLTECTAGTNTLVWDGKDDAGAEIKSGLYMIKIINTNGSKVMKVVKY